MRLQLALHLQIHRQRIAGRSSQESSGSLMHQGRSHLLQVCKAGRHPKGTSTSTVHQHIYQSGGYAAALHIDALHVLGNLRPGQESLYLSLFYHQT